MTTPTENFHRHMQAFIERYAARGWEGRDFEHELRCLISMAYEEAQRPFVAELNKYRELSFASLSVTPVVGQVRASQTEQNKAKAAGNEQA